MFQYEYEMMSMSVDCIIHRCLDLNVDTVEVLLIERGGEPYKGFYALPGGFVNNNETITEAVIREINEETNIKINEPHFIGIFDDPKRDTRNRVVSVCFSSYVSDDVEVKAGDDAKSFKWVNVVDILNKKVELAFDHYIMIKNFCDMKLYYIDEIYKLLYGDD